MSKTINKDYSVKKFINRKTVEKEISRINTAIDRKILRGINYRIEARKHAELTRRLRTLSASSSFGFNSIFSFL